MLELRMRGFRSKCRVCALVVFSAWVALAALYGLLKPVPSGCVMTYMYPTYISISMPGGVEGDISSDKYGLFLYHEGWKKIDFDEHLKGLSGVPVLFIPGNGGSYKQVRSLAAESDRAYQGGPPERSFYQDASLTPEESMLNTLENVGDFEPPNQYTSMLDWFAVNLEGEHSAMDGRILEEHTDYVVYAIHRILDQYQVSRDARAKDGAGTSESLPRSVILVGHSMGGFVARAALVHPRLRKSAVETILTLSSPHQLPPVALQPSLGHFFSRVNNEWRKGYEVQMTQSGRWLSDPTLSHVVVVSVSGGIHDYQVRTKLASLDEIVPPTHGFMISSTGMKNVWLSMDHQSILWCNQLVVQVSHTLLSIIDPGTGQPFVSTQKRLDVFSKMLRSGIPQSFNWMRRAQLPIISRHNSVKDVKSASGSDMQNLSPCPKSVHWDEDSLERDLYIHGTTVTVLAMDGRRRWLDIRELGSNGKDHFIFVTNLAPCSGVRLHLWPEKKQVISEMEVPPSRRMVEVTAKMVNIPAGPAPRQIEPGSQTEQAPPSAVLGLGPEDLQGFRFLTISVAPRPTVSGRPPPATSMAVGQFYNPKEGEKKFSPWPLLLSSYSEEEIFLKEDHPLSLNVSFSVSLGLLPVALSVRTAGCGIKSSELPVEQAGDMENNNLCKLRCFPPVALAWDYTSGLHVIPNLYSDTIIVDSSPAFWGSNQGADKTTLLLMVDPHCSYRVTTSVSTTAAAGRFLLLYCSKIIGFAIAVIFFALMRQSRAWELDTPLPSTLTAVEFNLKMPQIFLLAVVPLCLSWMLTLLRSQPSPPFAIFFIVSLICYSVANGFVVILILFSQLVFYVAATIHVFFKLRWQAWEESIGYLHQFHNLFSFLSSNKAVRILRGSPSLVVVLLSMFLVCFVHPALGLILLVLYHSSHCHSALCSFLAASFRSHVQRKEFFEFRSDGNSSDQSKPVTDAVFDKPLPLDENHSNNPKSTRSYGDTQLDIFSYKHGMLLLHLFSALMFVPSLVAWLQRIGMGQSFPWFVDSALCFGVILHCLCGWMPGVNALSYTLRSFHGWEFGLSSIYLLAGYYCFLSALGLVPYRAFYAMAAVGGISFAFRVIERRNREKGDAYLSSRKHSHRH